MVSLKILGALCAGAACMTYSAGIYTKAHRKCRAREDITKILAELEKAIPRQRALRELFPAGSGLPDELTKILCENREKPLYDALFQYPPFGLFEADEKAALQAFAASLGTYPGIDDELSHCKDILAYMEEKKAQNNVRDKQKAALSLKLGGLSAAILFIIFA